MQLLLTACVVLVFLIGPATIKQSMFQAANRDPSLSGRADLWSTVAHEGLKRPLFGHGYGAFWYEGRGREIVGTWNPRQSHNAYLDVFVDLGVVGLLAVVLIFPGGALRGLSRLRDPSISAEDRRVLANMLSIVLSLCTLYAYGESFFLKLDKFPMLCLLWFMLLVERIEREPRSPAHDEEVVPEAP
jgi:O-antigen ligase